MRYDELINNIINNKVPGNLFSINEGLKPNAYILIKNYSQWEYFFLDERGGRNDLTIFNYEEAAYDYLWKKLQVEISYPPSNPPDI